MCLIMLSIITSRNPEEWFSGMLAIMISRNVSSRYPEHMIFQNASKKCWRQMLAIIVFRNSGDECLLLQLSEMLATNVNKLETQRWWRQMLANIFSRNAGDRCQQLQSSEMLATNASNIIPRNADNNIYNYNF